MGCRLGAAGSIEMRALSDDVPARTNVHEFGQLKADPLLRQRSSVTSLTPQRVDKLLLVEMNDFHLGLLPTELAGVHEGTVPPAR